MLPWQKGNQLQALKLVTENKNTKNKKNMIFNLI